MGDYGIKISQPGESIYSPDQRLIFSSGWRLMSMVHNESFSSVSEGSTILTHNLGYPPMFVPYTNQRFGRSPTNGIASFNHTFVARVACNDTDIVVYDNGGSATATGRVWVLPVDLTKSYESTSITDGPAGDRGTIDHDYGIKVSLPGKDATTSTDLRDFAIHSGTRTPIIHKVEPVTATPGGSNQYEVEHNLGYPPMFYVYFKYGVDTEWQVLGAADDSDVSADNSSVYVTYFDQAELSVVILKDPLESV